MSNRYRNWCFTSYVEKLTPKIGELTFLIYQQEKCPSTGKLHFQGYVEFSEKKSIKNVQAILNDDKCHLETRKGSQKQAIDYCCKEESRVGETVRLGKPKQQGHRKDLDDIFDDLAEGMTQREILMRHGGNAMRHIRSIKDCMYVFWNEDMLDKRILHLREHYGLPQDPTIICPEVVAYNKVTEETIPI